MSTRRRRGGWILAAPLAALIVGAVATGCGDDGGAEVRRVPGDHATIQAAVDAARPGDLVLVEAGEYREQVVVSTDDITVRGVDRNEVVLDGRHELLNGVSVVSDGVAVENLTVRNFRQNGVIVNGGSADRPPAEGEGGVYGSGEDVLDGYRIAYVTAANNGTYGVYAFAARNGLIDHVYASGSPDSGIYVGQCKPCNVVVRDSVAAFNAIGYYGTNASGGVYVVESEFRHNRLGMTPNSQRMELLAPQVETVLAGNLVVDNDEPGAPEITQGFFGGGIAIGGGTRNVIMRNRVEGHDAFGIGLVDLNEFAPMQNRVEGNVLSGNGIDLYVEIDGDDLATYGNCFAANDFTASLPDRIETVLPCDGGAGDVGDVGESRLDPVPAPSPVDHRRIALPDPQPSMPGDLSVAPNDPAGAPPIPDLEAIVVPGR
jgi:hypothetical protein